MNVQLTAADTAVSLLGPGERMVTGLVPAGHVAVVLSTVDGTNVYVHGTPQTLRSMIWDGLCMPVPHDVPLVDDEAGIGTIVVVVDAPVPTEEP